MAKDPKNWTPPPMTTIVKNIVEKNARALEEFAEQNRGSDLFAQQVSSMRKTIQSVIAYGLASDDQNKPALDDDLTSLVWHSGGSQLAQLTARVGGKLSYDRLMVSQKRVYKKAFEGLTRNQLNAFFDGMEKLDLIEQLARPMVGKESLLHISTQQALKSWTKQKSQAKEQSANETASAPAPETINIVEVDNLLPPGELESDDGIGFKRDISGEAAVLRPQTRTEWLLKALEDDGVPKNDITLYRDKKFEENAGVPYHNVVDVKKDDNHFQIAVCDYVGFSTYIIRNPKDFTQGDDGPLVTIADLKKDKDTYQISCYSQEQWLRNIRHYTDTPAHELKEQLKTRIHWGNRKAEVEQSFAALYNEMRVVPRRDDDTIFEHGPLAGKTTVRRLYYALQGEAIHGLQHVRNFHALLGHVENMGLVSASAPAPVIDARDVFNRAVLHIHQNKTLPVDAALDRSFREGKVTGLEDFTTPDEAKTISSLPSFLKAASLAEEKNGALVPASPILIRELARHLKPE
jgi:hypothetical protein